MTGTQYEFPGEREAFKRKVESMLKQHRADIQRLWRRTNTRPQDFMGDMPHAENFSGTTTTQP